MKRLWALCLLALSPTLGLAGMVSFSSAADGEGRFTWTYGMQGMRALPVQFAPLRDSNRQPDGTGVRHRAHSFTILGFEGYVAGSCAGPAGWACRAEFANDLRVDSLPDDDTDLMNLTWSYLGGPHTAAQLAARPLAGFTAQSVHGGSDTVSYVARHFNGWSRVTPPGHFNGWSMVTRPGDNSMGFTQGPAANAVAANAVPEPGSLALAGLGLTLAGFVRRGRRQRAPA